MTPLFTKLNLKTQARIHVLAAPASFESELAALQGVTVLREVSGTVSFAVAFALHQVDVDQHAQALMQAASDDAVLWFAYPKGTSKRYRCDFNRDTGWAVLGAGGYEPVRQVAIDEDWSALRFRRAEHIKVMTRDPAGALSAEGRRRASDSRKASRRQGVKAG